MKNKTLQLMMIISLVVVFYSCEKEAIAPASSNHSLFEANVNEVKGTPNNKSTTFGNISYETQVYDQANSTDNYFEDMNPTVGEWISHFDENFSSGISIPTSTANPVEFDLLVDQFLQDMFSENFTVGSNSFRNSWLNTISNNTTINNNEKELISNVIYIANAFGQVVSNGGSPTEAHPWDIRFNSCMRSEVPKGPFGGVAWVLSGDIFLDVGDCVGVASNWW